MTTYFLYFRIEQYAQIIRDIHWTEKLIALFRMGGLARGIVAVPLVDRREHPETIYAVARFLWKDATGQDHQWNPSMSNAYNEAAKRLEAATSQKLDPDAFSKLAASSPQLAVTQLKQMTQEATRIADDLSTMRKETTRASYKIYWVGGLLLVLYVLSKVLR